MFAPPPVQFSRAELERRRQQKRQSDARSSFSAAPSPGDPKSPPASLHRTESNTSSRPDASAAISPSAGRKGGWFFGRGGDKAVPAATLTTTLPGPPPEPPKQHPGDRAASKPEQRDKPKTLSEAFGEQPRKAPAPPKRPPRPPSDGPAVPPLPGAFPTTPPPQIPVPLVPAKSESPPPVPDKSLKRMGGGRGSGVDDPFGVRPMSASGKAVEGAGVKGEVARVRSEHGSAALSKVTPGTGEAAKTRTMRRGSGSFGNKVEKHAIPSGRRASAAANVRAAVSDMESMKGLAPVKIPRRATDSELQTRSAGPVQPSASRELSWKRRQKGETMSMLLNDGFFPVQEYIYSARNPNISVQVPFPPPPSLLHKELPDTPSSIVPTPTELYQSSPTRPTRPTVRPKKSGQKRRSPLAPLAVTDAKANNAIGRLPPTGLDNELSPSRLSAIPEGSTVSENTPSGSTSGMSTPLATKIHLRGGSVITLSPPELTAWKPTYYLPGPIKLPKPTILPRKGSTASMDAFQEVVDQVYQEALNIPRRRSDDQVVDDICEFFDDFCFEELGFEGDVLGVLDVKGDDMADIAEEDTEEIGAKIERFATPPHEIDATPVEKVIAKEVVEHTVLLPPVETEETLRARGIARLSQGAPPSPTTSSRRASTTSRKDSTALPLLPVPETTMLDVPPPPAPRTAGRSREDVHMADRPAAASNVDQGFDWDDDVEELDALSSWVAPAAFQKKYTSTRESKNPMKRMRRFVATASAIL